MTLDWLIVGGGIHGSHLAARLLGEAGVAPDGLRIVDPAARLLDRWLTSTATTGMSHLRSPAVHNLDLDAMSLKRFEREQKGRYADPFSPPYERPALELFNEHCARVLSAFDLASLHIRDRVVRCSVSCDDVRVRLQRGQALTARHVILAIGASEQPEWPRWAPRADKRIQHIHGVPFDGWPEAPQSVAVIGGGISACQVALRLVNEGHTVHLVAPHALREHQFDSDPGWLGPKFMSGFRREHSMGRRRALIAEARHLGSVPGDIHRSLRRAMRTPALRWHEATVVEASDDGALELRLSSGAQLGVKRVLLATGFAQDRPGGAMVDELVTSASLPCAACGYPVVGEDLRWHPRIVVSGPLAELELGPASRNIAGALRAGDRLMATVKNGAN